MTLTPNAPWPGETVVTSPSQSALNADSFYDVAVVGAGVIGLSIGWRLASRGLSVAVFDRAAAGSGASCAATGMLAAATELEPGGADLLTLAFESQNLWPAFRALLEAESGLCLDYRGEGTLTIALNREEVDRLRFRHELQTRSGLRTHWLDSAAARALEPGLRASTAAGIFCDGDHQVDPKLLVAALCRAFRAQGGELFENCPVKGLDYTAGRASGVLTALGLCRAGTVIIATGAWTNEANLLPPELHIPVRPLKGQSLALRTTRWTGSLSHVVWTEQVHLAPKSDGRLIVGATMEECGYNPSVTAGGVLALLEGARRALPSIEEMEIEAIWTGFRPTSDDDAPLLGSTNVPGLIVATGHHRNGILLTPVTAKAIADLVLEGRMSNTMALFGVERFAKHDAISPNSARTTREMMNYAADHQR